MKTTSLFLPNLTHNTLHAESPRVRDQIAHGAVDPTAMDKDYTSFVLASVIYACIKHDPLAPSGAEAEYVKTLGCGTISKSFHFVDNYQPMFHPKTFFETKMNIALENWLKLKDLVDNMVMIYDGGYQTGYNPDKKKEEEAGEGGNDKEKEKGEQQKEEKVAEEQQQSKEEEASTKKAPKRDTFPIVALTAEIIEIAKELHNAVRAKCTNKYLFTRKLHLFEEDEEEEKLRENAFPQPPIDAFSSLKDTAKADVLTNLADITNTFLIEVRLFLPHTLSHALRLPSGDETL